LNSFDAYLFSVILDLVKNCNTVIPNDELWNNILSLPGDTINNKPHSYHTDDFGIITRTKITNTYEDKFGDVKGHDGYQRSIYLTKQLYKNLRPITHLLKR
jgi:hypothetical protein